MNEATFCKSLRQPMRGAEFAIFLGSLERLKDWPSQAAMVADPGVQAAFASRLADHFPRIWLRTRKTGRTSPVNLARFAHVFGFGNSNGLIREFVRWISSESKAPSVPEFAEAPNGQYVLPIGLHLNGNTGRYLVKRGIPGEQCWGLSYKAQNSGDDSYVFIKTLSLDKTMEDSTIRSRVTNLKTFLDREQLSLQRLNEVDGVADFLDSGYIKLTRKNGYTVDVPFVVMDFIDAKPLVESVPSGGLSNGALFIDVARQILRIVRDVHNTGLRHGDIRPQNFLFLDNKVFLVDFGESGMASREPHEANVKLSPYAAPERYKNLTMILETAEDIYAVGGVLLWLSSGKDPRLPAIEDRYVLRDFINAFVNAPLREYNPGIAHVISECLHFLPGDRVAHVDDVLQMLDLFENMRRSDNTPSPSVEIDLRSLRASVTQLQKNRLFGKMIRRDLSRMTQRATEMVSAKRAEIVGSRHDLIRSLLAFLSILSVNDQYITTTKAEFWTRKNLGVNGRFLCANKMLALNGVRIRRLFILAKDELINPTPDLQSILLAQAQIVKELRASGIETGDKSLNGAGYYVGVYLTKDDQDKRKILQEGYHVGIIRALDQTVSLSFPEEGDGLIQKIYLWDVTGRSFIDDRLKNMVNWFNKSEPVVGVVDRFSR